MKKSTKKNSCIYFRQVKVHVPFSGSIPWHNLPSKFCLKDKVHPVQPHRAIQAISHQTHKITLDISPKGNTPSLSLSLMFKVHRDLSLKQFAISYVQSTTFCLVILHKGIHNFPKHPYRTLDVWKVVNTRKYVFNAIDEWSTILLPIIAKTTNLIINHGIFFFLLYFCSP